MRTTWKITAASLATAALTAAAGCSSSHPAAVPGAGFSRLANGPAVQLVLDNVRVLGDDGSGSGASLSQISADAAAVQDAAATALRRVSPAAVPGQMAHGKWALLRGLRMTQAGAGQIVNGVLMFSPEVVDQGVSGVRDGSAAITGAQAEITRNLHS